MPIKLFQPSAEEETEYRTFVDEAHDDLLDRPPASVDDAAALTAAGFDADAYIALHPDVAGAGLRGLLATRHFLGYGMHEGRLAPIDTSLRTFEENLRALAWPSHARIMRLAAEWLLGRSMEVEPSEERLLHHIEGSASFRPLLVIGDSHIQAYRARKGLLDAGLLPLTLLCSAGSARGLANPKSRSGYGRTIRLFLQDAAPRLASAGGIVLFKFGQVDIEFVLNLRRMEHDLTAWSWDEAEAFSASTVSAYTRFLESLRASLSTRPQMAVATVFPPALFDSALREGYVNGHVAALNTDIELSVITEKLARLEFPSLLERTRYHAAFNGRLQAAATGAGFGFLNDFTPLLDGETIASHFVDAHAGSDHHIDPHSPALDDALRVAVTPLLGAPVQTAHSAARSPS